MVTPRNVHDSLEFDNLLEDSKVFIGLQEVILVFDKGYWKLNRFKELNDDEYRFSIPMKTDTKYETLSEKIEGKISDEIIRLSNGSRKSSILSILSLRSK